MPAMRLFAALTLLLAALFPTAAHAQPVARASVQQPVMAVGQTNTYSILLQNNTHNPDLEPPAVPGLQFARTHSTSTSAQIINGVASSKTTISWRFQAERPGNFLIPESEIEISGQRIRVNAVHVEVTEMPEEMRNRFFLRWQLPDPPFYVGQAIPATLQLFVRSGIEAGLGSAPEATGEQFILTPFSEEPRQRQAQIDGRPYVVVEWETVVTPIRPGPGDLPASLTLVYATDEVRRDFFGTRRVQEQIRLTTEPVDWQILDLPRAGRPASFSGAVGTFEIDSQISAQTIRAGDPLTLTLEVSGEGNFDRIQAPKIPPADGWRIYPPRSRMTENEVPFRGVKTFEYILTPQTATISETPALAFSWFDPHQETWQERVIDPQPISVTPGAQTAATESTPAKDSPAENPNSQPNLLPLATSPGPVRTLAAPWTQPLFWAFNGGMSLAVAAVFTGFIRQRRNNKNPHFRTRKTALFQAQILAEKALQSATANDAPAFYLNATQSLRQHLAAADPLSPNPESLTWPELETLLQNLALPEDSIAATRRLFDRHDAIHFANARPSPEDLLADRDAFESLRAQLATRK